MHDVIRTTDCFGTPIVACQKCGCMWYARQLWCATTADESSPNNVTTIDDVLRKIQEEMRR